MSAIEQMAHAGDELVRLLELSYEEARGDDPEIPCRMDGRSGGRCWCRQVRTAVKAWNEEREAHSGLEAER